MGYDHGTPKCLVCGHQGFGVGTGELCTSRSRCAIRLAAHNALCMCARCLGHEKDNAARASRPVEEHDPVVVEPPKFDEYVKVTPIPVSCERLEHDGLTSIYHYGEGRFWVRGEARRERSLRSGLVTR